MSGEELTAAGELGGGAGAARAIEPGHGEPGAEAGPRTCLNCGCALQGDYCHCCGQKGRLHFTIGGLVHDIVHGVLHLDGKFWRTLPLLAWKPGQLTRDYVEGKRARYISPIAIYLFTVVAMFALVVSAGNIDEDKITVTNEAPAATVEEQRERVAELDATLEEMADDDYPGASGARAGVGASLRNAERQLAEMTGEPTVLAETEGGTRVTADMPEEDGFWAPVRERFDAAQDNPSLFFYKVQTKAYKLSWLLIPLSLPFMWLLFPFSKQHGFYTHAVFVTYSISFMMLFTIVMSLAAKIFQGADWLIFPILLVPPLHMYRQLKGTYALSRGRALLRTGFLALFAGLTLSLFLGLMFALGALG